MKSLGQRRRGSRDACAVSDRRSTQQQQDTACIKPPDDLSRLVSKSVRNRVLSNIDLRRIRECWQIKPEDLVVDEQPSHELEWQPVAPFGSSTRVTGLRNGSKPLIL
jgi:hypothetical protein